jgi:hypothetical protein
MNPRYLNSDSPAYLQLSQFRALQVEQLASLEEEETNLPPDEKPKTEKFFSTSFAPHWGQVGFCS